jgi:hypothetical protein
VGGPRSGCRRCPHEIQWAEILVARRVEEVEGEPLMLKAHHRRGDRDAALALDRHPIRAHPPPLAARLHFARQLIAVLPASGCGRGSDIISDLSRSTSQEQL